MRRAPTIRLIRLIRLDLYEVDADQKRYLLDLLGSARVTGWLREFGDLPSGFLDHLAQEADATAISVFEGEVVPGLLQIEPYAREAFAQIADGFTNDQVERRVEARMLRQEKLTSSKPPRLSVILDESVLLRPIGGKEVMHTQLAHLLQAGTTPTTRIQILPLATGIIPPPIPINILEFRPDEPITVVAELLMGDWTVEPPELKALHRQEFERLRSEALSPQQSRSRIREAMETY